MNYIKVMERNEKTMCNIKIFGSTREAIERVRGNKSISIFLDDAVLYYIKHINDNTELEQVHKVLNEIVDINKTNLGLLCEVLRQEGVLNGNGEITPLSKKNG